MSDFLMENAKVMSKGQITIPKEFRKLLNLSEGDRVTLVYDGERVIMLNSEDCGAYLAGKKVQKPLTAKQDETQTKRQAPLDESNALSDEKIQELIKSLMP